MIPDEFLDAALVDGAGYLQRLRRIVLPPLSLAWMLVGAVVLLTLILLRLGRVWVFSQTDT